MLTKHCRPVLGGSLANPSKRFPTVFGGSLWREHPYLLACFSSVLFCIVGFLAIFFYLEEVPASIIIDFHVLKSHIVRQFLHQRPRNMIT